MKPISATIEKAEPQEGQLVRNASLPVTTKPAVSARMLNSVRRALGRRALERWAWQLAVVIIVPGGLILALLWWFARRRGGSPA